MKTVLSCKLCFRNFCLTNSKYLINCSVLWTPVWPSMPRSTLHPSLGKYGFNIDYWNLLLFPQWHPSKRGKKKSLAFFIDHYESLFTSLCQYRDPFPVWNFLSHDYIFLINFQIWIFWILFSLLDYFAQHLRRISMNASESFRLLLIQRGVFFAFSILLYQ